MSDVIYREAAIKALAYDMPQEIYADCIHRLEDLPSAEPEIVRCKDCKHWVKTVGYKQWSLGDCSFLEKHFVMCNGFCAWAERRTDD